MIVDGGALSRIPDEKKLNQVSVIQPRVRVNTNNIRLVVDVLNSVSGVVLAGIIVEILDPVTRVGDVFSCQRNEIFFIDFFRRDTT